MAALDFPSSPTNGQTYTSGSRSWIYNSTLGAWEGGSEAITAALLGITGSNTGDETAARIATALNAGTIDSSAADSDQIAVTSPAGGYMTLSTLWTWIKSKIDAGLTWAGSQTFSGQMELTGQAATNSTSAMTRELGDARYGAKTEYISTVQIDSTTGSGTRTNITGLTDIPVVAGAIYKFEFIARYTAAGGGASFCIEFASALNPNQNYANAGVGSIVGASYNGGFANSSTWIDLVTRNLAHTGTFVAYTNFIFSTSSTNTMRVTFSQGAAVAGTSSVLAGARLFITRIS